MPTPPYFHVVATYRQKKNCISRLKDLTGVWRDRTSGIHEVMLSYFQSLFTSDECLGAITPAISVGDNAFLLMPFSEEDIKSTTFSIVK